MKYVAKGQKYVYPNSNTIFVVKEVRQHSVVFECGHWCTDNVFVDLISVTSSYQLSLFTHE